MDRRHDHRTMGDNIQRNTLGEFMKILNITNDLEARLDELERLQIQGRQALNERNKLVIEMVHRGYSQAEVFHRLNQARAKVGGKPLSRDAVFMLVKRTNSVNES